MNIAKNTQNMAFAAIIGLSLCLGGWASAAYFAGPADHQADGQAANAPLSQAQALNAIEPSGFMALRAAPADLLQPPSGIAMTAPAFNWYGGSDLLSSDQAALYYRIFNLQAEGKIAEADVQIARLEDDRLLGHVLAQRYLHPTAYKSDYEELRLWLANYGDHPGADKIYDLALKRRTKNAEAPLPPQRTRKNFVPYQDPTARAARLYGRKRSELSGRAVDDFKKHVIKLADQRRGDQAQAILLKQNVGLDTVEMDRLRAEIAARYLYQGDMAKAYPLARQASKRSGQKAPLAGWIAGLIAWKDGRYQDAAAFFEVPAKSPYANGWLASAGGYWAARAHMRAGNVRDVTPWLRDAAQHPRTFYGLLANRALGVKVNLNWTIPAFSRSYSKKLSDTPAGYRAMALVAAGQYTLAESELLQLDTTSDEQMNDVILSYVNYAGLPSLGLRLGNVLSSSDEGRFYDAALYPRAPWMPKNGFKVDPALLHAIMRQESKFDIVAESHMGARGLMQVMPRTASYVVRKENGDDTGVREALFNPRDNLEIAQLYIKDLLGHKSVQGNIVSLLIAYNAGPGNLARWRRQWDDVSDPLLFMELIPVAETRNYVERVLTNYWIYRMREGNPAVTLEAMAEGRAPLYSEVERTLGFQTAAR